ncbi:hypothetical protein D5086_026285 [Populus alba]|uniref:Uncharacterized protein n=1 Tax=Populus alba TaxID=43335 RepID=A0ACC4B1I4_POPAL
MLQPIRLSRREMGNRASPSHIQLRTQPKKYSLGVPMKNTFALEKIYCQLLNHPALESEKFISIAKLQDSSGYRQLQSAHHESSPILAQSESRYNLKSSGEGSAR